MFAALELLARETGIKNRIRNAWRPGKPELRQVNVRAGAAFFVLSCPWNKRGLDWEAIRETAGRLSQKLLLPPGVVPPEDSGCAALVCTKYRQKLLFNTGLTLIKQCGLPPRRTSITVLDSGARLTAEIRQLMPLAATVRVISERPERYRDLQESLMDEFGASLLVTEAPNAAQGITFILALDSDCPVFTGDTVVFSNGEPSHCRFAVSGSGCILPEAYAAVLPPGIVPEAFAEALYEHCSAAPLGALCYETITLCGAAFPMRDMAAEIKRYCARLCA